MLVQDLEKLQEKDIKDKKLDLVEELEEVLKEVKHLYIEDYQKEVLKIYMQKNYTEVTLTMLNKTEKHRSYS